MPRPRWTGMALLLATCSCTEHQGRNEAHEGPDASARFAALAAMRKTCEAGLAPRADYERRVLEAIRDPAPIEITEEGSEDHGPLGTIVIRHVMPDGLGDRSPFARAHLQALLADLQDRTLPAETRRELSGCIAWAFEDGKGWTGPEVDAIMAAFRTCLKDPDPGIRRCIAEAYVSRLVAYRRFPLRELFEDVIPNLEGGPHGRQFDLIASALGPESGCGNPEELAHWRAVWEAMQRDINRRLGPLP